MKTLVDQIIPWQNNTPTTLFYIMWYPANARFPVTKLDNHLAGMFPTKVPSQMPVGVCFPSIDADHFCQYIWWLNQLTCFSLAELSFFLSTHATFQTTALISLNCFQEHNGVWVCCRHNGSCTTTPCEPERWRDIGYRPLKMIDVSKLEFVHDTYTFKTSFMGRCIPNCN